MRMSALLKAIFSPNDGTRRDVHAKVVASRVRVERAANRLEVTIREMMDRNDRLTGRAPNGNGNNHG